MKTVIITALLMIAFAASIKSAPTASQYTAYVIVPEKRDLNEANMKNLRYIHFLFCPNKLYKIIFKV